MIKDTRSNLVSQVYHIQKKMRRSSFASERSRVRIPLDPLLAAAWWLRCCFFVHTWRKVIYTVSGRNVENRFTQIIVYLHGSTEKRLPFLAESRKTESERCAGASLAGNPILLAGSKISANLISWLILVIGSKWKMRRSSFTWKNDLRIFLKGCPRPDSNRGPQA